MLLDTETTVLKYYYHRILAGCVIIVGQSSGRDYICIVNPDSVHLWHLEYTKFR